MNSPADVLEQIEQWLAGSEPSCKVQGKHCKAQDFPRTASVHVFLSLKALLSDDKCNARIGSPAYKEFESTVRKIASTLIAFFDSPVMITIGAVSSHMTLDGCPEYDNVVSQLIRVVRTEGALAQRGCDLWASLIKLRGDRPNTEPLNGNVADVTELYAMANYLTVQKRLSLLSINKDKLARLTRALEANPSSCKELAFWQSLESEPLKLQAVKLTLDFDRIFAVALVTEDDEEAMLEEDNHRGLQPWPFGQRVVLPPR